MLDDTPTTDEQLDMPRPAPAKADTAKASPRPPAQVQTEGAQTPGLVKNSRRQIIAGVAIGALAVAAYVLASWWTVGRFQVTTDDAYVGARAATLSPKASGYVTEIAVGDNAPVKKGDLIARIDPVDYQLAVRSAHDQIETQRATIDRIGKQVLAQQAMVEQAKAQAASARAALVRANLDFKRQTDLNSRQINSVATLENSQATRDQAIAAVASADAAVASATATVAVYGGQRMEAENVLKQNETSLAKSERDLSFTELRAPFDGVFGNRAMQVGDFVQPAQRLASLVPLQDVYIDANFKETQLSRLQVGQKVKVTVDAQSGTLIQGEVVSVAPASGSVFSLLPPDNATGNFTKVVQRVTVRIAVPAETAAKGILRPGMSVVVSVDTKAPRGTPQPAPTAAAMPHN